MNNSNKDQNTPAAILLAAGFGSRIQDVTMDPKCLLPVNGRPIIDWHIRHLEALGVKNILVIDGYKKELLEKHLSSHAGESKLHFIENSDYRKKGNTYSLYLGLLAAIERRAPVIIFDGDLVYEHEILKHFIEAKEENLILVGKGTLDDIECAKALVDASDNVRKLIDKRAVTEEELREYQFAGEAIGILKFSHESCVKMAQACERFFAREEKNIQLNWEHLMNEYLPAHEVKVHHLASGKGWMEIDTSQDYRKAQELFADILIL